MKAAAPALAVLLCCAAPAARAEAFSFDASEYAAKPFEVSGSIEQKGEALRLRSDRPAYRLAYPGESGRAHLLRSTTTLEVAGKLTLERVVADFRGQASSAHDALVDQSRAAQLMDGGVRWSADAGLAFDIGKRVQRWGKGYAWSPVAFVERPRDANDPQLAREGFVMGSFAWTQSFGGPLSSVGLSALVVPTRADVNADFGAAGHLNPAARLTLLVSDTDIDLLWRGKGARAQSFGVDFSRNLGPALEVHGEWARSVAAPRSTLGADGQVVRTRENFASWLLGLRYLSQNEVTWIAEYYRNGAGYGVDEREAYTDFLERALAPGAPPALANRAPSLARTGYGQPNAGRDYLYLKASVAEPLGWVYGSAALTAIANLGDGSVQITPEVAYSGYANVELRARLVVLAGRQHSEFAEKAASSRFELTARFYF